MIVRTGLVDALLSERARIMVKIEFFLVVLAICSSNNFTRQELLGMMQNVNSEYLTTNTFSKFDYKFNRPKVIKTKNGVFTRKMFEEIRKARFGVVIHFNPSNDEEEEEEESEDEDDKLTHDQMKELIKTAQKAQRIRSGEYDASASRVVKVQTAIRDDESDEEEYQFESD
jgi:hypothetical protein